MKNLKSAKKKTEPPMENITVRLDQRQIAALKVRAKQDHRKLSEMIRIAVIHMIEASAAQPA